MSNDRTVTHWIEELKCDQADDAQQQLWNRYFGRLVGLARQKLGDTPRRVEDEEDVALCALDCFFEGVQQGRFPELKDRTNLWPLLAKITLRKAIDQRERQLAKKRWAGQRGHSAFVRSGNDTSGRGFDEVACDDPTPATLLQISEETRRMLDVLQDDNLRKIALLKMHGHTNAEIANEIGLVNRTVERKLERIRQLWSTEHS